MAAWTDRESLFPVTICDVLSLRLFPYKKTYKWGKPLKVRYRIAQFFPIVSSILACTIVDLEVLAPRDDRWTWIVEDVLARSKTKATGGHVSKLEHHAIRLRLRLHKCKRIIGK